MNFEKYTVGQIFKFRENMSNYIFREIYNSLLSIVKVEYLVKQIISLNSPAHKL